MGGGGSLMNFTEVITKTLGAKLPSFLLAVPSVYKDIIKVSVKLCMAIAEMLMLWLASPF